MTHFSDLLPQWDQAHRGRADRDLRKSIKGFLRRRDGDRCYYCSGAMKFEHAQNHPLEATIEHLTPKSSRFGNWAAENLALAHRKCNLKGGCRSLRAKLETIGRKRLRKERKKEKARQRAFQRTLGNRKGR